MNSTLLFLHSIMRWFVVLLLLIAIINSILGLRLKRNYTATDKALQNITIFIVQMQFLVGIIMYWQSPIVAFFWKDPSLGLQSWLVTFYGVFHPLCMVASVSLLTGIGRKTDQKVGNQAKFKIICFGFILAFLIIFIAIPWPFSPLSSRPFLR